MRFRSFDKLSVFNLVARRMSFSLAADELCLTKGAVSHQIKNLESELGFDLFVRKPGNLMLTEKGKKLWHSAESTLKSLEKEVEILREDDSTRITIGTSTYFASRWLSPRLMTFINDHPNNSLLIHPMINLFNLQADNIDMAIRWGKGDWSDLHSELLFECPAFATAGNQVRQKIDNQGLVECIDQIRLLHNHEDSQSWMEWFEASGFDYPEKQERLVIPDPNVRTQAAIDNQGLALNDSLASAELNNGALNEISEVRLSEYGYFLVYPIGALENPALSEFRSWILNEAASCQH